MPVDLEHGKHVEAVLGFSAEIAESHGAYVHLFSVIRSAPVVVSQHLPGGYEQIAAKSVEKKLAPLVAQMGPAAKRVNTCVRFGGVYQEILAYAKKIGADLMVIGSHRPDVGDYLLGSNASRVVRHADCSVFVVLQCPVQQITHKARRRSRLATRTRIACREMHTIYGTRR